MDYAAIISLKLTLQQILLHPYRYIIPCDNKHIESLHEKLEFLQRFLEENSSHRSNGEVTSLQTRISDAAYEAGDFTDHHLKTLLGSEEMEGLIDVELMMKKVDPMIEEVTEAKEQMGSVIPTKTCEEPPMDSLSSTKNLIVGFDEYLMQIKHQLTGKSSALEVISIVGMGGIGKTTLGTNVYNDPYAVNHFDIRVWATVSQPYSVRDFLLGVLDSMKILTKEMLQEWEDQLRLHVYHNLKHRRYLIIIDDVWDTNVWDFLRMMFPDDEIGSRIVLTTRVADVAACASPSGTLHQISPLSDDQSWMLLCAKVFGDQPCPLDLQEIGMRIAKNCGGLPLSIVVIGGLLSKVEKTQMAWQPIAEYLSSSVFSSDDRSTDILRLSYNHLPQHLKACFLYMGVLFPKGHEIHVSKLTKMLAAEGFLRQGSCQCPEKVAERCVEDLLDRSLILTSKKNYDGKIKSFKIHDLLLDFCTKEAKDEKFLKLTQSYIDLIFRNSPASERRVSIHQLEILLESSWFHDFGSLSHLRSVVCVRHSDLFSTLISSFKLLRVLDAAEVWFLEFPPQVLELLNLRYLGLLYCGDVPASIRKLWNLQTLVISGYSWGLSKSSLPAEIWMMAHLRHVRFDRAHLLDPSHAKFYFNQEHTILGDLQSLTGLLNLEFSDELLQSIPNVEKIDVSYDAVGLQGKEWSYYKFTNLGKLHHLKALKIRASSDLLGSLNLDPPSFKFPPSLKTLNFGWVWNSLA